MPRAAKKYYVVGSLDHSCTYIHVHVRREMHVYTGSQFASGVLKIKICGAVNSAPKRKSVPADDRSAIFTSK